MINKGQTKKVWPFTLILIQFYQAAIESFPLFCFQLRKPFQTIVLHHS